MLILLTQSALSYKSILITSLYNILQVICLRIACSIYVSSKFDVYLLCLDSSEGNLIWRSLWNIVTAVSFVNIHDGDYYSPGINGLCLLYRLDFIDIHMHRFT